MNKIDKEFKENPFAKKYKKTLEAREFVRRNSKSEALKSKKK